MKLVHVVGRKNHGKTTLIVELLRELTRRDLKVGTIKHSHHLHELDVPGKDSHRHRTAGAAPSAVVTPELAAVFAPRTAEEDIYERLSSLYVDCDLVLVEGHIDMPGQKVEVWRQEVSDECLANQRDDILAVIADGILETSVPVWPRDNVSRVADEILKLTGHH